MMVTLLQCLLIITTVSVSFLFTYLCICDSGPTDQDKEIRENAAKFLQNSRCEARKALSEIQRQIRSDILAGEIPDAANPPSGCAFHNRCKYAKDKCQSESPKLREFTDTFNGEEIFRQSACHFVEEIYYK